MWKVHIMPCPGRSSPFIVLRQNGTSLEDRPSDLSNPLPAFRALWMRWSDYLFFVGSWSSAAINQAGILGLYILSPQTEMECGRMIYSTSAISLCPSYLIWNQFLRRVMSLFRPNPQNAVQGRRCGFARTHGESKGNSLTFVWTS